MAKKDEEVIGRLDELMTAYRAQKKQSLRNALIFTGYLVIVLIVFSMVIKAKVINNFSAESIEKSFTEKVAVIQPLLPVYADTLIAGVPETYASALSTELQIKLPMIQANFLKETTALTGGLKNRLERKLQRNLGDTFITDQLNLVAKNNPNAIKNSSKYIKTELTKLINNVSKNFQKLFDSDMNGLVEVVKAFPREKEALLNEKEATKLLMHYLIGLVDVELMTMEN